MICPKCGQEASGRYCNECGAPLVLDELDFDYIDVPEKDDFEEVLLPEETYAEYPSKTQDQPVPLRAPKEKRTRKETKKGTKKEVKKKTVVKKETASKEKADRRERRPERTEHSSRSRVSRKEENFSESKYGTAVAKGAAGVIVLCSRILQWISFCLMAVIVLRMVQSFIQHKSELGSLATMISEKNYGLALYVGVSVFSFLMGIFWCLWIISKKSGGGEFRMKKYDVGRGFIPFLICLLAVFCAGFVSHIVPESAEAWKGLAGGAAVWLRGVNELRDFLISVCLAGAVCSLIRKMLRV